jgi:hypothetical protein
MTFGVYDGGTPREALDRFATERFTQKGMSVPSDPWAVWCRNTGTKPEQWEVKDDFRILL